MPRSRWIVFDGFGGILALGQARLEPNAVQAFEDMQTEVLEYARSNAPWADRTGAARDGLETDVYVDNGEIYLDLYHTVEYGQWLETIQNGAFATIMPTLEVYADRVFDAAGGAAWSIEEGP